MPKITSNIIKFVIKRRFASVLDLLEDALKHPEEIKLLNVDTLQTLVFLEKVRGRPNAELAKKFEISEEQVEAYYKEAKANWKDKLNLSIEVNLDK